MALPIFSAAAVEGQGCAGGKCGITTTLSPSSGPTGSQVNLSIVSGAYPLDGNYDVWFSKSPTMSDDPTAVKVAEGFNQRLQQSVSIDLSVPEASAGTNYFHFIKAGQAEQMINFTFMVTPSITIEDNQVSSGGTDNVTGTGFTPSDDVTLYVDGVASSVTASTDDMGTFSVLLPLPSLTAGTHIIKATAKHLYNQDASVRVTVATANGSRRATSSLRCRA